MSRDTEIRTLIERWAEAVHRGDMEGVLADHADDLVMFDVPPPHDGVRGLDAYRETWPGFFAWQAQGATFEIVTLDVTAGDDVAFAHALLRCDDPRGLAEHPERRLRLTLGLRREDGRWVVAHEHHSFALDDAGESAAAERAVRAILADWSRDTAAKDLDGLMASVAEDVVSYEHAGELAYIGREEVREVCRRGLDVPGDVAFDVPEMTVLARGDLAVAWGIDCIRIEQPGGERVEFRSRGTRVFRRTGDVWEMVHQHLSFPADPTS